MSSLRDKTAIVTGGASGIGLAISTLFAEAGASVSILDFDEAAGSTAARGIESLGGVALPLKCDVSDSASIVEAVGVVVEKFGGIDILVNNAGVANIGTATTTSEEDFDRVMRVNVKGVYQCLNAILPVMVKSGGGVVLNMSSIAAVTGLKDRFA